MGVTLTTFLCVIGEEGIKKYGNFKFKEENDRKKIVKIFGKFTLDSEARTNIVMEKNEFF